MQHLFWLVPDKLCGRPGPNHQPWRAQELKDAGIGAVLSVNNGESVYADEFESIGMACRCIPLASNAPPRPGDLELCRQRLPQAYAFARGEIETDKVVMVHCRHGKDRTGLFMAYYLMARHNLSSVDAIAKVMSVRPIALTATGWSDFSVEVLDACQRDLIQQPG